MLEKLSQDKLDKVEFKNEKRFLSNMFVAPFRIPNYIIQDYPLWNLDFNTIYTSSEHFYQSMKSDDREYRRIIINLETPEETKKIAKKLLEEDKLYSYRKDWLDIKDKVMEIALFCKFSQNRYLLERLDKIEGEIIERNYWKDIYWGVCDGIGENKLGKMLMNLRDNKQIISRNNKKSFKNQKVFLPVIHVTNNIKAVWDNVSICIEAKADGIFLISHGYKNWTELLEIGREIKKTYPDLWVGYNFLDLTAEQSFKKIEFRDKIDGLWIDDTKAGVSNEYTEYLKELNINYKLLKQIFYEGNLFYFGGVAFKYCEQPEDIYEATAVGMNSMDVVTTSGDKTGNAPTIEKIKEMYSITNGTSPLALASGVDEKNITEFLQYVDIFLVSSSISENHEKLNKNKTIKMANIIANWNKN